MNTHGSGGYFCCGKVLHSRASLKYHFKTHHIVKCPLCQEAFTDVKDLQGHVMIHQLEMVKIEAKSDTQDSGECCNKEETRGL